jgi:3-dehydroquinate synthase
VEIVKCGIIKDRRLFSFVDKNLKDILGARSEALEYIIFRSCSIKARVVERDEFDTKDLRAILNFGHTIGHAIEAAGGFSGSVAHGRAVASGMVMASQIALELGMLKKQDHEKISALVRRVAIRTKIRPARTRDILKSLAYDKKFIHGVNRFILPSKIGSVRVVDNVPQALIKKVIEQNKD